MFWFKTFQSNDLYLRECANAAKTCPTPQIRLVPPRRRHRLVHGGLRRGGDVKHYFDESFRQLTTATTIPISAVIGPVMDQVVVLLIWLPPSTPNPWSAQIRPNSVRINPTVNVTTKVLLIWGSYPRFSQLLSKTWTARPPRTDRISRFVAGNSPGVQRERIPVRSMAGDQVRPRNRSPHHRSSEHCLARRLTSNTCGRPCRPTPHA